MLKITLKQRNNPMNWSMLVIGAFLATSLWAGWRSETIFTGSNQIFNFAIGDARNDGKPRIYTQMANLGLVELGYLGSGQWSFDTISILPSSKLTAGFSQANNENEQSNLVVGPGRNDGVNRIYLCPYNSDSLYEFTYSNGDWIKRSEKILQDPSTVLLLKIAPARNDDTFRVYVCNSEQRYAPDTLYEITWRNGDWNIYRIPLFGYAGGYFTVGKGRNDDTVRLYMVGWTSPWEMTYRGEWEIDTMFSLPPVQRLLMGEGHSDGLNRLYGEYRRGDLMIGDDTLTLYEITHQNGEWEIEIIDETIPEYPLGIHLKAGGLARNDDTFRLYGCNTEKIWEYTYRSAWIKEEVGVPPGYLYIGKGRGDDSNRLYVYGNAIIEFSYSPTGVGEDKKNPGEIMEKLLVTPNLSFGGFKIQYSVSEDEVLFVRIYNAVGRSIQQIAGGYKRQGRYTVYWDGKDSKGNDVGNGVFFCQLKNGKHTISKKIIRLK